MPDEPATTIRLTVHDDESVTVAAGPPAGSPPPDDPYAGDIGPDDAYAGVPFLVWRDYLGHTVALAAVKRDAFARGAVDWRDVAASDAETPDAADASNGDGRDADSLVCPACGGELVAGWAQLAGGGRFLGARVVVATERDALSPRSIAGDLAAYQCVGCNAVFIP